MYFKELLRTHMFEIPLTTGLK